MHRSAYNSVSEVFTLGKILKTERGDSSAPSTTSRRSLRDDLLPVFLAFGIGAIVVGIGTHGLTWPGMRADRSAAVAQQDVEIRYATGVGEIRNFALQDGSSVTLDTNGLILASYMPGESAFRLIRGRARFYASRNRRPFVVRADTTLIRSRGAVFDVTLQADRNVRIHSISGDIEVRSRPEQSAQTRMDIDAPPEIATLVGPSQRLAIDAGHTYPLQNVPVTDDHWPEGVEQFDNVPLAALVDQANRYAVNPIRFDRPTLADLKISGTFHLADTDRVAQQIATLLGLQLKDRRGGYVLRNDCAKKSAGACFP